MLGRLTGIFIALLLLPATALSAPVTFQIDGYFNGVSGFSDPWVGLPFSIGDRYTGFLTVDDAAGSVGSSDFYPSYRQEQYPITSFTITFTATGTSVSLPDGVLEVNVYDYDSDLGVTLRTTGTQPDGSTVRTTTPVAYEMRTRLSEPSLEEAIYLMDQQGEQRFRGMRLQHSDGQWEYGTCLPDPALGFGRCDFALRTDKVSIITPGYTPAVPPGAQDPVPAPIPLPAGAALSASAFGMLLWLKRRPGRRPTNS